ncbi:MAG: crossover junction endodeoxyribonuclease RuvC, partial [Rhodospirillaceae bacterium]
VGHRPSGLRRSDVISHANPASTLKLGQARGIVLMVPASLGLPVHEYPPNLVKKTVVGSGHAAKEQIQLMVKTLLPG